MRFKKLVLIGSIALFTTVSYGDFYINPTPLGSGKSYTLSGCTGQTSVDSGAAALCDNASFPANITLTNTSTSDSCSLNVQSSSSATGTCQFVKPVSGNTFVINGGMSSGPAPSPTPTPSPSPTGSQAALFSEIGIGTAYGPHYPVGDARNDEFEASVPQDFPQLKAAGFKTIRAYGDPAKVWIAMINQANKDGLHIVYQFSLCKADAGDNNACINVPGSNLQQIIDFSSTQLTQVVNQVTPAVFNKVVKLIIVGNEDLVQSKITPGDYDTQGIINAMNTVRTLKQSLGISKTMPIGTDLVAGQSSDPQGKQILAHLKKMGEEQGTTNVAIENLYPFMYTTAHSANCPSSVTTTAGDFCPEVGSTSTSGSAMYNFKTAVDKLKTAATGNGLTYMVGETGWPTSSNDKKYTDPKAYGSVTDAAKYASLVYQYATTNNVPVLYFEAYDQPTKVGGNGKGKDDAEQHYGVLNADNTLKGTNNKTFLPAGSHYSDSVNSSNNSLFTFYESPDAVKTIQLSINGGSPQNYTSFKQKNASGVPTWVWGNVLLSQGDSVALYQNGSAYCTNTVASVDTSNHSGGKWSHTYVQPCGGTQWGSVHQANNDQNIDVVYTSSSYATVVPYSQLDNVKVNGVTAAGNFPMAKDGQYKFNVVVGDTISVTTNNCASGDFSAQVESITAGEYGAVDVAWKNVTNTCGANITASTGVLNIP